MLPRTGVFPVRGPFGNASGHNLAMAGSLGTHQGTILPWPAARERIGMISCRGRQLGNASGRYLATARRRMIATEVHRRPISDRNGDERPMPKTPFMLLKGLIAFLSAMRLLPKLLITLRRRLTSTMKPAHKYAQGGNTEGKEEL